MNSKEKQIVMNTKYCIRLFSLVLIFGLGPCKPIEAPAKNNSSGSPAFTYQFHADSNSHSIQSAACGKAECGPENSQSIVANSALMRGDANELSGFNVSGDDEEGSNTLFGFALGNISSKNLAVAFFCLMSGMLFLLFGLKGW